MTEKEHNKDKTALCNIRKIIAKCYGHHVCAMIKEIDTELDKVNI